MERPLFEPDPFFDAIGRVVVAWGLLESELGQLLKALLHTPLAGVLAVGQSYDVLHSHIRAIVALPRALEQHDMPRERLSEDIRRRITDALAESQRLAQQRNRIIRGIWLLTATYALDWINLRPRRGQLFTQGERVSLTDMHQTLHDIERLTDRVELIGKNVDHRFYLLTQSPGFPD